MDVNRVGQRPDALLQDSASTRRETRATERPESQERAAPREAKKAEPPKPPEPERTKPVVNTQGQVTGTRINTSA